jgi:hypothetical protein
LFDHVQQYLLLQILLKLSKHNEYDSIKLKEKQLIEKIQDESVNSKMIKLFEYMENKQREVDDGRKSLVNVDEIHRLKSIFQEVKHYHCGMDSKKLLVCKQFSIRFIPVQNVNCLNEWVHKYNIKNHKYKSSIFIDSVEKINRYKMINCNYPIISIAVSDKFVCKIFFLIYNSFSFTKIINSHSSLLERWAKKFFGFRECFYHELNIPLGEMSNLQDFLLILEMIVLRRRFNSQIMNYKTSLKVRRNMLSVDKFNFKFKFKC